MSVPYQSLQSSIQTFDTESDTIVTNPISDDEDSDEESKADSESLNMKEVLKNQVLSDEDQIIVGSLKRALKNAEGQSEHQSIDFDCGEHAFDLDELFVHTSFNGDQFYQKEKSFSLTRFRTDIINKITQNFLNGISLIGFLRKENLVLLIEAMSKNSSMKTLFIENHTIDSSQVTIDSVTKILALNKLEALHLSGIHKLDENGRKIDHRAFGSALRTNKTLKKLTLNYTIFDDLNTIDVIIMEDLKYNKSITELSLEFKYWDEYYDESVKETFFTLMDCLEKHHILRLLTLSFDSIHLGILNRLCSYIEHNTTLRYLKLEYNDDIKPKSLVFFLRSILNSIKLNSSLTFIEIDIPQLDQNCVSEELLKIFLELSKHNINLTRISMGQEFDMNCKSTEIVTAISKQLNLNYLNLKNRKYAFLLGLLNHPRNKSSIKKFGQHVTFDINLIKLIFDFAGFTLGKKLKAHEKVCESIPLIGPVAVAPKRSFSSALSLDGPGYTNLKIAPIIFSTSSRVSTSASSKGSKVKTVEQREVALQEDSDLVSRTLLLSSHAISSQSLESSSAATSSPSGAMNVDEDTRPAPSVSDPSSSVTLPNGEVSGSRKRTVDRETETEEDADKGPSGKKAKSLDKS